MESSQQSKFRNADAKPKISVEGRWALRIKRQRMVIMGVGMWF